jgi:hypothetical protein
MAEPEFFGIGISTIANLGVAIGTGLLAYYTYKSVKTSEEQVKLARNSIEKPRILEKIHNALNSIKNEMDVELGAIDDTDLVWLTGSERNNLYTVPLVFPISPKKEFNVGFRQLFTGPEYIPTEQFSQIIGRVDENLNNRYDTYRLIDQELSRLEGNIRRDGLDQRINSLLLKLKFFRLKPNADDSYSIIQIDDLDVIKRGTIPKKQLYDIIVSIVISTLFKPLKKDELRLGCLGYVFLTGELFPHIENSILDLPVPDADSVKKRVLSHLASLKGIDENILADINSMKEIYREKYILTEAELDPYKGMW